jgi:uridine kinase
MTPKLTELIDRAATLSPQERLDLLTYLQSSPDRVKLWSLSQDAIASGNDEITKVLAEWQKRDRKDELQQVEPNANRSISSKYAGTLEFSDAEFEAMLKELEDDK